jgi:transposase-like protein
MPTARQATDGDRLAAFACPNPDCDRFNRFAAGNLRVCERFGRDRAIRRLYCTHCQHRFSERRGTLMAETKLPEATVTRILKCLAHGCSVEATADICEVDARTVERILDRGGRRAEAFHQQQLRWVSQPVEAVELDELHGRVCRPPRKKGRRIGRAASRGVGRRASRMADGLFDAVVDWVGHGFTSPSRGRRGS